MTNTAMLKSLIDESGYKREHVAKKLGISRFALYQKVNGQSDFTTTEVQNLCEVLGINDPTDKERIFFAKAVDE